MLKYYIYCTYLYNEIDHHSNPISITIKTVAPREGVNEFNKTNKFLKCYECYLNTPVNIQVLNYNYFKKD